MTSSSEVPPAGPTPSATRREWLGLAVLVLPILLISVDFSVLNLALPQLTRDLSASSVQQLWILDIYGFMMAGFLITMGVAAATLAPSGLALINHMFQDPKQRAAAVAVFTGGFMGGAVAWPGGRRGDAGELLVGVGVPARSSGGSAPAGHRADPAA